MLFKEEKSSNFVVGFDILCVCVKENKHIDIWRAGGTVLISIYHPIFLPPCPLMYLHIISNPANIHMVTAQLA